MTVPATTNAEMTATNTILQLDNLVMHFPITQGIIVQRQIGAVHAVDGSFAFRAARQDDRFGG